VKAAFFKEHGGAEKILYDDYRDPVAEAGEVVVRVRACALNQVDMLLLDGRFPPPEGLPHVNGCEVTGTVEAVGAGVKGLAPGQRVIIFPGFACGRCEYCLRGARTVCVRYGYLGAHKDGGYAELVKAPAANILPLAEAISFEAGAAVPMAMLTSWHALVAQAGCRPGQTVLVQAAGSGVGPQALHYVLGITKAYTTRVGSGPFPTELYDAVDKCDPVGEGLAKRGHEFGSTTGRARRCGWFDAAALKRSIQINGVSGLCITKLDVMDGMETVRLGVGYRINGVDSDILPVGADALADCQVVYEDMPGWNESTVGVRRYEDLPLAARSYLERIAKVCGVPVDMVSTGPDRDETIVLRHPFA